MMRASWGAVQNTNRWTKEHRLRVLSAVFLLAMVFSVSLPTVASAHSQGRRRHTNRDRRVSHSEVQQTLQQVPGVLESSDQTAIQSDSDSAATTTTNGTVVDVPKDATQGVTFGAEAGPKLGIQLPNAGEAKEGTQVAPGTVAYESTNGSANAVQATEDGGVRMLTIIDNPNAPTAYDYKVSVPQGGRVELTPDGGALVLGADATIIASVAAPWAKDAVGKAVQTWFTTDGQTLAQHVKHNVPGIVYPVTGDPHFSWGWTGMTINFNRDETNYIAIGGTGALAQKVGTPLAAGIGAAGGAWIADQARKHGLCLTAWKSHVSWWFVVYMRRC